MPIPVNNNCSARSMENARLREAASRRIRLKGLFDDRRQRGMRCSSNSGSKTRRPLLYQRGPATRSIVEVDVLVVNDRPLLVPHDVVAVQTVAVLVEIILAFRAGKFL